MLYPTPLISPSPVRQAQESSTPESMADGTISSRGIITDGGIPECDSKYGQLRRVPRGPRSCFVRDFEGHISAMFILPSPDQRSVINQSSLKGTLRMCGHMTQIPSGVGQSEGTYRHHVTQCPLINTSLGGFELNVI